MVSDWFSVGRRNPGHWDIAGEGGRHWRIRGEPGKVLVIDERDLPGLPPHPREWTEFKSVSVALAWIADHYLIEEGAPR